jgi:hypothetical protein
MNLQPPAGSKISIMMDGTDAKIVIPYVGGPARHFTGLFLLFWLGMWTIGFKDAGSQVLSGNASGFVIFWLGAWTLGGVFAALTLYRAFRPPVPESLELKRNGVTYDSGGAAAAIRFIATQPESEGHPEFHLPQARSCRSRPTPTSIAATARNRLRQPPDDRCGCGASRYRLGGKRGGTRVAGRIARAALRVAEGLLAWWVQSFAR